MKITELLEAMYQLTNKKYSFEIFQDYSGAIKDFTEEALYEWSTKEELQELLVELENKYVRPKNPDDLVL